MQVCRVASTFKVYTKYNQSLFFLFCSNISPVLAACWWPVGYLSADSRPTGFLRELFTITNISKQSCNGCSIDMNRL